MALADLPQPFCCPVCRMAADGAALTAQRAELHTTDPDSHALLSAHLQELLTTGFVVLRGCVPAELLEACRQRAVAFAGRAEAAHQAQAHLQDPLSQPQQSPGGADPQLRALARRIALHKKRKRGEDPSEDPVPPEYSNFKQRQPLRYDLTPPEFEVGPATSTDPASWSVEWLGDTATTDALGVPWLPLMRFVLGTGVKPMARGIMLSKAGAAEQDWHSDGPPLCADPVTVTPALPVHALNVFLPLVPVGPQNGTALVPGSHLATKEEDLEASGEWVVPELAVGDALVFDYRLVHRGQKNDTNQDRPVVYLSYSLPWFTDEANFNSYQYGTRLDVPASDSLPGPHS